LLLTLSFVGAKIAGAKEFSQSEVSNNKVRVLEVHKEIKDLDALTQRAKKGISDDKTIMKYLPKTAKLVGEKKSKNINVLNTVQLLKKEKESDGTIVESYSATQIVPVTTTNFVSVGLDSGDQGRSKADSTLSVRAYSRVYFNIVYHGGAKHYDLTKVTGGWDILDWKVAITNQHVIVGQRGLNRYGKSTGSQSFDKYTKGETFSYTVPSSWVPVVINQYAQICVNTWATLVGYADKWSLYLQNHILGE